MFEQVGRAAEGARGVQAAAFLQGDAARKFGVRLAQKNRGSVSN